MLQLRRALHAETSTRRRAAKVAAKTAAKAAAKAAARAAKVQAAAELKEKRQLMKLLRKDGYSALPAGVEYDKASLKFFAVITGVNSIEHCAPLRHSITEALRDLSNLQ